MKLNFLGPLGTLEMMIIAVLFLLFYILPMVICYKRAEKLNQSKIIWGILGLFLSYIAVLLTFVIPANKEK